MLELFFRSKTEYIYIEYTLNKHIMFLLFFIKLPMFRSIIRIKLCHYCILQLLQYNCTPKPPEPSHNPKDIHR